MTKCSILSLLFASLVLTSCQAARLNPPQDAEIIADQDQVVDDTEIVLVTPSPVDARSLLLRAKPLGYTLLAQDDLGGLGLIMLTLKIPPNQDGASAIRELESLEPGVTAGVNHGYTANQAARGSRPGPAREYAADLLGWPQMGCPVYARIGVLDSKLLGPSKLNVVSADFSRGTRSEKALHGTQIVTLLNASGMLKSPQLFHADIVSPNERLGDAASVDSLLRGLNWMIVQDVRVVNVSLAGPYNKILDRAFASAERRGIIVVAPAGNAGPRSPVRYPAAFTSTIAVTAVDAREDVFADAVRGVKIDFSAPGVDVAVSLPGRRMYVSGTSFAAPFVTARIASDPALKSARDASAVRNLVSQSARDLGASGHDATFGFGLIQAPPLCN